MIPVSPFEDMCLPVVPLRLNNIEGNIRMGTDLCQCTLMATLQCWLMGTPVRQHHDLISHSVTLSWHWANQFLPSANNAEHQARKQQAWIFKSSVWLDQVSNPNQTHDLKIPWSSRALYSFGHADWSFEDKPNVVKKQSHYTSWSMGIYLNKTLNNHIL